MTQSDDRRSTTAPEMTEHAVAIPNLPSEHTIDRLASALEPVSRIVQPTRYGRYAVRTRSRKEHQC